MTDEPTPAPPPIQRVVAWARSRRDWAAVALLAALAYVPSLRSAPGKMPTDTKLYLYLNPGRLIADAPYSWDVRQFGGWVPHQTMAYLWPSGPWYWVFDKLGVPDWVAHRLWIATIMFAAGLGVRWAAKRLGLTAPAALVAALVYQLSPYVLPYISRTSSMLLPWAAVGWLVGLTIRACSRTRWRDAAIFALVVASVSAVNATAIILVAPAPVLWLVHAAWQRTITWRRAIVTAAKLGGLSLLVSLWWIAMLVVQGRHGADVLSYSETLEAVSHTSSSTEVLRSLGYWLFYIRDPYAFTTTASIPYMQSVGLILVGYLVTAVGLAGLALTRWTQRRYAAMLVFVGAVLAVGVHPIADPSPLSSPLKTSALGLAIRSSTRALPLFDLGIALGAGSLVAAVMRTRWRWRPAVPVLVGVLAFVNLPALRDGGLVDPALERDQDVPAAWQQAVAALDASSSEYRVMQLPGSEFGAFRWGYTVDPPLPGLTDKPLITRDLLPLGSPGVMDLLYALDNRIQQGTLDPSAIAPVARLLGVDTIWVPNDIAFDRFRTPRPELVAAMFGLRPVGLGQPVDYGTPVPNSPAVPMVDEQQLADGRIGQPLAPVELVPVDDPQAIVRASAKVIVLSGSGDGVVDAAAAGLLQGDEALRYSADLTPAELASLAASTPIIVTDSNRDRATQWRSSQDVVGFTERGGTGSDLTAIDTADQRLPVFPNQTAAEQTTAVLDGGLQVSASAYGEPFAYRPEDRPAMAVDGDPSTAWLVGDRGDPIGQSITVAGLTSPSLQLLQRQDPAANRTITSVRIEQPGVPARDVTLDDSSRQAPGQAVPVTVGRDVTIVITGVTAAAAGNDSGPSAVGFAELGPVATEVVRTPTDALTAITDTTPLDIVLTRDRIRATNRWRSDPEPTLSRELTLPVARRFTLGVTLHLDDRATDDTIDRLLGVVPVATATSRLTGVTAAGGEAAVDGNPASAWTTPFEQVAGAGLTIRLQPGATIDGFDVVQPQDGLHSPITALHVHLGATDVDVAVPPAGPDGRSHVTLPAPATGDELRLTITDADRRTTIDRRYGEQVQLPAAIDEITGLPLATSTRTDTTGCRSDLLQIDGSPVGLQITAATLDALRNGDAAQVQPCTGATIDLAAGTHRITSAAGLVTGADVDRLVLDAGGILSGAAPAASVPTQPTVSVTRTRTDRTATVGACPAGCWLILGEGYNTGWSAHVSAGDGAGHDLGAPQQIAGGFNGWWLPPSAAPRTVQMTWTPQEGLDLALVLAALGVLACIAVAIADRRRREPLLEIAPPELAAPWARTSREVAVAAGVLLVVAGALAIAPLWGAILVIPAAIVVLTRRVGLLLVAAVLVTGWLGLVVARREHAFRYPLDAAWPDKMADLHRWGMLVFVLVLAGGLIEGVSRSSRAHGWIGRLRRRR